MVHDGTVVAVSWEYAINPARHVIYTRMWGSVTMADFLAVRSTLTADPQFDPSFSHISDLRDCAPLDVSASDIGQLASRAARKPSRRAIVVSHDVTFGLARMYELRRQLVDPSGQIQVFRTLPEALTWLGLDDADLRKCSERRT
jgi:hypothetical protein